MSTRRDWLIIGTITENDVLEKYKDIIKHPGMAGTDDMLEEGLGATLFNMGINGIFPFIRCFKCRCFIWWNELI